MTTKTPNEEIDDRIILRSVHRGCEPYRRNVGGLDLTLLDVQVGHTDVHLIRSCSDRILEVVAP